MTESATLDTQLDAYSRRAARRGTRKPNTAEVIGYTAAAGGLAFAGGDAMGAIIHNTTGATFSVSGRSSHPQVDLDGVGGADWGLELAAFIGGPAYANHQVFGRGSTVASGDDALKLSPGSVIGPTLASGAFSSDFAIWYRNVAGTGSGPFFNGTTGYLGLRFDGDTGTLGTQYAWVKVRFDYAEPKLTMNILEWAYDDEGCAIAVGATSGGGGCSEPIPTPATPLLTLLGLGALSVQAYRRRREEGLKRLAADREGAAV
jgi:hypothetical protein